MIIGIIGAMDEEVDILLQNLELEKKVCKAKTEFNYGKLWSKQVVICRSGIGKVNAAVSTQILIDEFDVDYIINVGVAGGIRKDLYPGDVVVAENLVQHDVDTSVFGDKLGQIPRLDVYDFKCSNKLIDCAIKACNMADDINCKTGRIVSGDQFVSNVEKIKWLQKNFCADVCEMEGASIAHVCYLNSVPFIVIRSISDNANNGASIDYNEFKNIAVKNSCVIIKNMLTIM